MRAHGHLQEASNRGRPEGWVNRMDGLELEVAYFEAALRSDPEAARWWLRRASAQGAAQLHCCLLERMTAEYPAVRRTEP